MDYFAFQSVYIFIGVKRYDTIPLGPPKKNSFSSYICLFVCFSFKNVDNHICSEAKRMQSIFIVFLVVVSGVCFEKNTFEIVFLFFLSVRRSLYFIASAFGSCYFWASYIHNDIARLKMQSHISPQPPRSHCCCFFPFRSSPRFIHSISFWYTQNTLYVPKLSGRLSLTEREKKPQHKQSHITWDICRL